MKLYYKSNKKVSTSTFNVIKNSINKSDFLLSMTNKNRNIASISVVE